jgi:multiple antibiotic resistance protein
LFRLLRRVLTALVAVAVVTIVMWLLIILVARLGGSGSGGYVHDMVTRFMGLIVVAMGVQSALSGMRSTLVVGCAWYHQRKELLT